MLFFVAPAATFSQGTIGENDDDNKEDIISQVINLILNLIWFNMGYLITEYINVEAYVLRRQNGLCHLCKGKFNRTDMVVSRGHPRTYYHKECAERLNVI